MKASLVGIMLFSLLFWSCQGNEEMADTTDYDGPLLEADSIQILYSDSAVVRISVEAAKQYEYEDGNREFPEGIYVEFYEPDGSVSSTLMADKGYYFKKQDRYTAVGNVVVEGRKENNRLDTDTLHWSPPTERVYTKAPVLITEGQDSLRGLGLEAKQDFSTYTILEPDAITLLDEEDEQ
ncbi:MAG: LPS export ABC transporter periplasmic protein LptC [Bacteroidetes bacterium]|nr:LPS export ABC transporter periplasmic protein LptC [Bacteroidota bacterium]